jgi:hypothetical protein
LVQQVLINHVKLLIGPAGIDLPDVLFLGLNVRVWHAWSISKRSRSRGKVLDHINKLTLADPRSIGKLREGVKHFGTPCSDHIVDTPSPK